MPDTLLSERADGVLTLTLNRPAKKNALTVAMYQALSEALADAAEDPDVRVVLLTGGGDAFTSGNDLGDFVQNPPTGEDSPVFAFLTAVSTFPKPLVAAACGAAIGIGTTVLLHCDLVYAAPGTRLQLPFVNLGLCPEAASSLLLPRVVGHHRAMELLLLGEPFSAEQAHQWGLVNAVFPKPDLVNRARERALALAQQPPAAVRLAKQLVKAGTAEAVAATIRTEGAAFMERLQSPEAAEAFTAFFEKRAPDFSVFA